MAEQNDTLMAEPEFVPGPVPLGQLIERLSRKLPAMVSVPPHQQAQLVALLWELWRRRKAAGRNPNDERNAAADMHECEVCGEPATCQGEAVGLGSGTGARCDGCCSHDWQAGCELLRLPPDAPQVVAGLEPVGIADPDDVFGGPPDAETMAQDLAATYDKAELTRIVQLVMARLLPGEGDGS